MNLKQNKANIRPQSSKRNHISENRNKIIKNEIPQKSKRENNKENPTNKKNYGKVPN